MPGPKTGWGKGFAPPSRKPGAHARRAIKRKARGKSQNVNARVDVGVEVVGRYVGDNKQPAGN